MRPVTPNSRSRNGVLSMELVLVLPLVLVVLFGVIELSLLFSARQTLVAASRAGARTGALAGATFDDVKQAIQDQVGPPLCDQLTIDADLGRRSGDQVCVQVRAPMRSVSPDLLRVVGFGLDDRELVAETVMSKE
ncbi:MAG: pilus assembly protein [Planctomycetes bacterium]|nr:pilus assembly protein [Planctomycetota bacterium]